MERVAAQMTGRWQLAMIIAAILPLLDSSIINVILPDIAQSLPGELATMPWLVTLYLIASAAGVLLSGYLTARWGFRCVWRASLTVFAAASVVLALASRFDVMLLGRVLLGVAAGVLMVLVPTLIVVSVAADQVRTMMGRISVPAVFTPAAGPLLGALLSESGSWRLAFWLNLPLLAVALWLGWPMVRENVRAAVRFNRVVFLLFFLAFFCLMLSLISGPYFAAAALRLFGLALWLNQIMTEPLFTLALFRHAHYAALMGLGVLTALLFYGFLVYYPLASVSQGDFPVWYLGAMLALQGEEWHWPALALSTACLVERLWRDGVGVSLITHESGADLAGSCGMAGAGISGAGRWYRLGVTGLAQRTLSVDSAYLGQ
ncbi:MFS transporter [Edwardsiella tarda]|uniref:MFS transporter n=1 Tax=Edwardsiella tarda TaxID=636 RepID=UPI00266EF5DC|nr:MFS transporter [Edwardsiella tarda]WKS81835.1 MFS transporter [Edwardsiella tarda]